MYTRNFVRARRGPFLGNEILVFLGQESESEGRKTLALAEPVTLKTLDQGDGIICAEPHPTIELDPTAAQRLMDELWDCGVRPTEGTGSAGALAATERHLQDLQKIIMQKVLAPQNQ